MRTQNESFLYDLPGKSVLSVCGAGGKTGLIHELRDFYLSKGLKVLVTTTTHMMNEGNLLTGVPEIKKALLLDGYAFAGRVDSENPEKITGPGDDILISLVPCADITLIEADGARHKSFKVPYGHEPVIFRGTTHIAVVYGRNAAGKRICDCAYNPEGTAKVLGVGTNRILDEEMMVSALKKTYVRTLRECFPEVPVCLVPRG